MLWLLGCASRTKQQHNEEVWAEDPFQHPLSGPLNRLNAILSLLHPLDRCRTPLCDRDRVRLGGPYLALSRIQTQVGVFNRLVLNRLGGAQPRDSGEIVPKTPLKQAQNNNAIEAAILNASLAAIEHSTAGGH